MSSMAKAVGNKIVELATQHAWTAFILPIITVAYGAISGALSDIAGFYASHTAPAVVLTLTLILLGASIGVLAVSLGLRMSEIETKREQEEIDSHNLAQMKRMPIGLKKLVYRAYIDGSVEVEPNEQGKYLAADQIFDMETIMPPKTSVDYMRSTCGREYQRWTLKEYARELLSGHEEVFDVFR